MALPEITHDHFLTLYLLSDSDRSGRELRALLGEQGLSKSPASFYLYMACLESARLVRGWYAPKRIGDETRSERRYALTERGVQLWEGTRAWYVERGHKPPAPPDPPPRPDIRKHAPRVIDMRRE